MKILGILILLLAAACLLIWKGRTGHPLRPQLDGWLYAHRGYHCGSAAPENSRAAFRRAVERGFGAEFDVHLLADGGLAVLHDCSLKRMTGAQGDVEDLTTAQLADYTLGQSGETIPTLQQTLDIFAGRVPLIIELKTRGNNGAALFKAVCPVLDRYGGPYCIESFDPRVVLWLKRHRPDILRGQLSCDFLRQRSGLPLGQAFGITYLLTNLFTRPDFVAYQFRDRRNLAFRACRRLWGVAGAGWTLQSKAELDAARAEGLWPIFEGFDPETGAPLEAEQQAPAV